MKLLIFVTLFILILSCSQNNDTVNLIVNAKMIRSFDSTYEDNAKRKSFVIDLTLINRSYRPVTFWIMNCSWQENFIINYPIVNYEGISCTRNFPVLKTLKSKDRINFKILVSENEKALSLVNLKFGFLYIDSTKCKSETDFRYFIIDRSKQEAIFWSNPVYLDEIK